MVSYPAPQERMLKAAKFLRERDIMGATWFELGEHYGWHHGQSSSVLSTMHREKRISRLKEKRGKSYIYVDNERVNGRPTDKHGRQVIRDHNYEAGYVDGIAEARAIATMILQGTDRPLLLHNSKCWQHHPGCALNIVIKHLDNRRGREAA